MQATPTPPWEQVFVRHVAEAKRADMNALGGVIRTPFEQNSGVSGDGGSPTELGRVLPGKWMLAVRFSKLAWVPLFANDSSGKALFDTNASSRRLEVAHVGCEPAGRGWFFKLSRAGKPVLDFAYQMDTDLPPKFDLQGVKSSLLDGCQTGEDVFERLASHYAITFPLYQIRVQDGRFQVIGGRGKPIKRGAHGYVYKRGFQIARGESDDGDALVAAIDTCDLNAVRQAVNDGASLTALPDSSASPLQYALYKCDRPGGKECVALLIELGAPIDGVPGGEPTVILCCQQFIDESLTVKMLETMLPFGIDVNAKDVHGKTALFESAAYRRQEVVKLLLQHGADPLIEDERERSTLTWLENLKQNASGAKEQEYAELLCLVRGETYAPPPLPVLAPELAAENERVRICTLARKLLEHLPTHVEIKSTTRAKIEVASGWDQWQQELLDAGFQLAGNFVRPDFMPVFLQAYTQEELGFDAVLTSGGFLGDELRCELNAIHPDGSSTTVTSFANTDDGPFVSRLSEIVELVDHSPRELIDAIGQRVADKEVLPLEAKSFLERYSRDIQQHLEDLRAQAEETIATPTIFVDGRPPRFERMGYYPNTSSWEPSHSTQDLTDHALRSLEETDLSDSPRVFPLSLAVGDAMRLIAMRHLQFASAPQGDEFIHRGCEIGRAFLAALAKVRKTEVSPCNVIDVTDALMIAALVKRWDVFDELCNLATTKLTNREFASPDDPSPEYTYLVLTFVSDFRKRRLPKTRAMEEQINGGPLRRPKQLLKIWQAVRDNEQATYQAELERALRQFRARKKSQNYFLDITSPLATMESVICLAARRRGLEPPPLDQSLADNLVTPASIGLE